nr:Ig-like domain protein [Oriental turtle dovepox virus]
MSYVYSSNNHIHSKFIGYSRSSNVTDIINMFFSSIPICFYFR